MKLYFALLLLFSVLPDIAQAKDIPAQVRLFAGSAKVDPVDFNTELAAENLKKLDLITQYGIEALYPVAKYIDVGLRYTRHYALLDELTSPSATEYEAQVDQDSVLAIVRVPFFKTTFVRADAFAGFGGSNTTVKIKTASQDGELNRKDKDGWFARPYSSYGGSLSLGYKMFYIFFEGGVESNKIDGFTRTGTVNSNVDAIDLSGAYFSVGVMFNGSAISRK